MLKYHSPMVSCFSHEGGNGTSPAEKESMLLMASVLFTMALVQWYDSKEPLTQLLDVECNRLNRMGIEVPSEDFYVYPVVQFS